MEWKTSLKPVPYEEAVDAMEARVEQILAGTTPELVWLLEHPPIYTAGTSAKDADLMDTLGFPVYKTGRGGQYTYHGPGQRIAYVMLDLKKRTPDVRFFVKQLERWIITTLASFGVQGHIREGRVGVWVNLDNGKEAKIAALGVRLKKWVTFHGIAINLSPDLSHYRGIVPCGITDHGVTSLAALGVNTTLEELDRRLKETFRTVFETRT
jgi:lipoyl(octanoyl) transferase